jgi:hypothetical protein
VLGIFRNACRTDAVKKQVVGCVPALNPKLPRGFARRSSVFSSEHAVFANGQGIVQGSGPQFARIVPRVPPYAHHPIAGVTQPGTIQWLNPDAFVSTVDLSTGIATEAIIRRTASSGISPEMPYAAPISSGTISISRNGSPSSSM